MAKQQITTLASKLILDTREFEDGTTASRKELNTIRKAMQETETPLEKYERKMEELGEVLKKDARFQETYNRKAEQLAKELKAAERAADGFHDEMEDGAKSNRKWAVSATELNQGLELAQKSFDLLRVAIDSVSDLDNQIYELEKYGVAAENFGTFKVLAGAARLETEALADATKNLTIRLGEAVKEPESGIAGIFKTLGLNAEKLAKHNPIDQLREFSKAVQAVPDYTSKLQIVDELLSDSGTQILDSILLKSGAIEEAAKRAQNLGLGFTDEERSSIEKAAKASQEMYLAWEGFTNQVKVFLAPILKEITSAASLILQNRDRDEPTGEFVATANRFLNERFGVAPTLTHFGITTDAQIRAEAEYDRKQAARFGDVVAELRAIRTNQETLQPSPANIGQ